MSIVGNATLPLKIITILLVLLSTVSGVVWKMAYTKVTDLEAAQKQGDKIVNEIRTEQAVVNEKVKNIETKTNEIREEQKEQNKKLDELLRRTK